MVIQLSSLYCMLSNIIRTARSIPFLLLLPRAFFHFNQHRPQRTAANLQKFHSYFKEQLPAIEGECGELIKEMGQDKPNLKTITSLLDNYLNINREDKSLKTLQGVLGALMAMQLSGLSSSLPRYKMHLLEQINRVPLEGQLIDQQKLSCFVQAEQGYRKHMKQKAKLDRLLFNFLIILYYNFPSLHYHHYYSVLKTLNPSDSYPLPQMQSVASLLHKHIAALMRRILAKDPELPPRVQSIFKNNFLGFLAQSYKTYGVSKDEMDDFQVVYRYIKQKTFSKYFSGGADLELTCNFVFRNFNEIAKDANGVTYKSLLLQEIIKAFLSTPKAVASFAQTKHGFFFASSIITHQFYLYAQNLPFQQEGSLKYVSKDKLPKKPELPEVFKQIYIKNPEAINAVSYLESIIRRIYPQIYISTKALQSTIEPFMDTEFKSRAEAALRQMGQSFQSELNIEGRYIDFLLEDDVILQMDGVHHFRLQSLEMTDKTHARNADFLLKGYRLVLVNIHEYNIARQTEQLKELIKAKLTLLREKNAVIVM